MKKLGILLAGTALAALAASPAWATLQISITDGTNTFSCFDGQIGCDLAGGAHNILTLNDAVGHFLIDGTLSVSQSAPGADILSLSNFGIVTTHQPCDDGLTADPGPPGLHSPHLADGQFCPSLGFVPLQMLVRPAS